MKLKLSRFDGLFGFNCRINVRMPGSHNVKIEKLRAAVANRNI